MSAVWYLMRGSGLVSLVLLSASVCLGVATWGGVRIGSLPRFAAMSLHRSVSLMALVFLGVHVACAVIDPYAGIRLIDVVIPFAAARSPLAAGAGAIALDLLLAVAVTAALRHRIGPRVFRGVHLVSYAAWPVALGHSLGFGSDVSRPWMWITVVVCGAAVGGAAAWRLVAGGAEALEPAR